MMPGHRRCRLLSTVVAAEAIVGGDLVEAQHAAHGEVIFKMRVAKLALQPADLGQDTTQSRIINTAAGESLIKLTFLRQNLVAKRHGRVPHLPVECTGAITLILGEIESACQLQYVRRSRIAVQLGRHCQAHTAPGTEILDLLLR